MARCSMARYELDVGGTGAGGQTALGQTSDEQHRDARPLEDVHLAEDVAEHEQRTADE